MITLSNGHSFEYMAASGALAFDGNGWPWEYPLRWTGLLDPSLFTIVIKTLTRHPRKGNLKLYKPWTCIRFLSNSAVNAVGLTNPGIEWWHKTIGPSVWNYDDIAEVRKRGARAVSFGSVFMNFPWRPTLFIRKDNVYGN